MENPSPTSDGQRVAERAVPTDVYHAKGPPGERGLVYRGETVEPNMTAVHCSSVEDGQLCTRLLGWPPVGSELVHRTDAGARFNGCEEQFAAFRCPACKRISVFALPEVAGDGSSR